MRGMINLLGPLFTRAFKPGASEVKSVLLDSVSDSSTRATVLTPTSGKKARIISCSIRSGSSTVTGIEVYFDTGANIRTNAGKEIAEVVLDAVDLPTIFLVWPDSGGPVGAVDEVISLRTGANITNNVVVVIHYREE
ncbi:hypothetical protein LCGC14_1530070 [marine sediment metagenome]|uniref:Uncharacterized protein n=1 Tax=marine sediment metagenome TaxID=412755 RepID=A0A0F9IW23_9ZZZZ